MFNNNQFLTESEKIDYIYKSLKNQNRTKNFFLITKLIIFWWIIYFYLKILPNYNIDKILNEYVVPKIQKVVQLTAEQTLKQWENWTNPSITPEMLQKAQDIIKSKSK